MWDGWGRPVYPAIIWNDRRTGDLIDEIGEEDGRDLTEITGLIPDPYFSAVKIRLILDQPTLAGKKKGELLTGTIDSWMIYKLTSGNIT